MSDLSDTASVSEGVSALRIVVVDDHGVVRAGLKRLIDDHEELECVGEAGDVRTALEVVEVKRPDVVVLDIELGADSSLDSLPAMLSKAHKPKVLILSMHDDVDHVQASFAAGADGFLIKDAAEQDLVDAITTLARGERYLHPVLGARLTQAAISGPSDPLTDREREITRLLALGHTNQEISKQLFLSVRTVETHRAHVIAKLGLNSRAELVQWALDQRLIAPSGR
jgi:two-component system response regulator NreC